MGIVRRLVRHAPFGALLVAGTALRAAVLFAYRPGFEYADSREYLVIAARWLPTGHRPIGYSIFLSALSAADSFVGVFVAQHTLGLLMAAVLYVVLLRMGVRPWLAALGAAPLLLDAYQVDIEHFVLSETVAETLLVAAVAVLLWDDRPRWWQGVLAGLFLAGAADTRSAALPLIAPALLFVLLRGQPGRRILAGAGLAVAFAAPLALNMSWNQQYTGQFALSNYSGQFLYGRMAVFADCSRLPVTGVERRLCPNPAHRLDVTDYVWSAESPFNQPWPGYTALQKQAITLDFSLKVLRYQTLDYLRLAAADSVTAFAPARDPRQNWPWVFTGDPGDLLAQWRFAHDRGGVVVESRADGQLVDRSLAADLAAYQRVAFVPGTALGILALMGLVAGAGLARRATAARRLRWAALFLSVMGLGLIVVPAATIGFDYRYVLPSLVALPPAAAAAAEVALRRRWLEWGASVEPLQPDPHPNPPPSGGREFSGDEAVRPVRTSAGRSPRG